MEGRPIVALTYRETLMERSEDGTLYQIEDPKTQFIAYLDESLLDEHLELEWNKDVYDGEYFDDYTTYMLIGQTETFDDDDNYVGFERIFKTDDDKEIFYEVKKETGILVIEED